MTVWYVAPGAGLAALLLLSVTTAIGALMTGRTRSRAGAANRVVVSYLHRVTASLGLGALALHLASILADSYAHVGIAGAVVPFTAGYRPTWVGLGTLAVYTFVLVGAVGVARGRMAASPRGVTLWRGLHSTAYVGWALAMLHGLRSGTDSSVGWVRLLYVACAALVLGALAVRLAHRGPRSHRGPRTHPGPRTHREWRPTPRVATYSSPLGAELATREQVGAHR